MVKFKNFTRSINKNSTNTPKNFELPNPGFPGY
jgi:hypothetical protein